ncbi:flagellar assembly protein FliX [Phenylobacterium sp. J426]|uniref:flagellar assembly regulator FliX n=1 Tax=Phenylobacterium sp. J426 TaxID=2898439 RepID=UPI0021511701|nr:flagellar assembly protein FliX [Phenylobacterium sp. J426]MCR5876011.1 flagellar assembly protein FliX [Phenylobacterium sp. J426]
MKVSGTGSVSPVQGAGKAGQRPGGDGFRLAMPAPAAGTDRAGGVGGVASVMGVEALLALQDVGGPLERKRRSVRRAGQILDVLEGLKVALLGGDLDAGDLDRLRRAVQEERQATDDARLEGVLDEIETRAAVELAKLEAARRAA